MRRTPAQAGGDLAEQWHVLRLDVRLAQSDVPSWSLSRRFATSPRLAERKHWMRSEPGPKTDPGGSTLPFGRTTAARRIARLREISLSRWACSGFERRRAATQIALSRGRRRRDELLDAEQKAHRVFWRDRRDLGVQLQRWDADDERLVPRSLADSAC